MIPTNGTHSPFDSDACIEWAIYCHKHKHNPDIPLTDKEWQEFKKEYDQQFTNHKTKHHEHSNNQ